MNEREEVDDDDDQKYILVFQLTFYNYTFLDL